MSNISICIGKVIEISNASIVVTLTEAGQHPYRIINASPIRIGGVGDFVRVNSDIYEIVSVKTSLDKTAGKHVYADTQKVLVCNLIGFFKNNVFCQGNSGNTPNIFENVYTITDEQFVSVYAGTNEETSIVSGKYLYADDLDFRIDINKFFASHILIVGNTGSGKSNSLNTIYSKLFQDVDVKKSKFLVIDTNGEYSKAFTGNKSVKRLNSYSASKNDIKIPICLLTNEDWKLLLEATEKTQYPIIKKVWNGVRKNIFDIQHPNIGEYIASRVVDCMVEILNSSSYANVKLSSINSIRDDIAFLQGDYYIELLKLFEIFDDISVNNTRLVSRDGSVYSDITNSLIAKLKGYEIGIGKQDFDVNDFGFLLNLEHIFRTFKFSSNENNTGPMIGRFNSNKNQFSKIFTAYSVCCGEPTIIESVFGKSNIVVCDVSNASKDIRRIIVTFICGKLYREFASVERGTTSLHLIVDEAHNYLSHQNTDGEDPIAKTCIETFEGIIKEGRKFGVFLTMSTQRPSDITGTLLSQAHNYVIHKLVNPKDIDIIKNTVPFIDAKSISMLSILAPGQAIFSGTAFNRPNIIQVELMQETTVDSQTIKLLDYWEKYEDWLK